MQDDRHVNEGRSGYSFWGLVSHAKRLIFTTDFKVLGLTSGLALVFLAFSVIYGGYVFFLQLFGPANYNPPGWTSLMIVVLMPIGALWAIRRPSCGLQDRLAGSRIVPS